MQCDAVLLFEVRDIKVNTKCNSHEVAIVLWIPSSFVCIRRGI